MKWEAAQLSADKSILTKECADSKAQCIQFEHEARMKAKALEVLDREKQALQQEAKESASTSKAEIAGLQRQMEGVCDSLSELNRRCRVEISSSGADHHLLPSASSIMASIPGFKSAVLQGDFDRIVVLIEDSLRDEAGQEGLSLRLWGRQTSKGLA